MDDALSNGKDDGVFLGRYVLVDYDDAPIKAYGKKDGDGKVISFYNTPIYSNGTKIEGKVGVVYEDLQIQENTVSKFYVWNGASYVNLQEKTPYYSSFETDVAEYGRGYDSTVWVKRYDVETNKYKYAMIAELNAVVPTLHLVIEEPNPTPMTPYFDRDTTNIDYYLHTQGEYGTRVKRINNSKMRSDESIVFESGRWVDQGGYSVWQENEPQTVNGDIYYNNAGFDPEVRTYSQGTVTYELLNDQGERILDENNRPKTATVDYSKNQIGYDYGRSGRYYGPDAELGKYSQGYQADDIYDWFVRLPGIGNAICKMWDKVYGYNADSKRFMNNAATYADKETNLVSYDRNTMIGVMNTAQDLIGYHFIPMGGTHSENHIVEDPEATISSALNYDYGKIADGKIDYKVLDCIFFEKADDTIKYYCYTYSPFYKKIATPDFSSGNQYFYKDSKEVYHLANSATHKATDANGNVLPDTEEYYLETPQWKLTSIDTIAENNIYSLIAKIHQMLGTNVGTTRNLDSIQGSINAIKDIITNIDTNLAPGKLIHTNNNGVIETTETYFPSADWDKDKLLAGDGRWVSRYASVKVRENSTNANRKIPKVVEFETTGETAGSAPVKLANTQQRQKINENGEPVFNEDGTPKMIDIELISDNQRSKDGTTLIYEQDHDPNTLIFATRDKWIKLHPDDRDDSIEFEHTQSPLVTKLSYEALNAPGTDTAITGPANEVNSSVNTENFEAVEEGTAVVIRPSIKSDNDVNDLTYDSDVADKNDNRLTIPTITVDNAGHVIAAGTKNYNIPHGFKKVQTTTIEDTVEVASTDQEGISIAENLTDTLFLSPQNRWIDISTEEDNNAEGASEDKITFGHRLVPTLNTDVTLNGERRTSDTEIPTVYRYGLPADKDISALDEANGANEAANTFNVPYIEVDKAGHVVAAETHTVQLPDGYTTVTVGAPSTTANTAPTTGTAGATSDDLAKAATLTADTLTESLALNPSNKWIRISGSNTKGSDVITIGHEIHNIIPSTESEDLDTSKKDKFTTQVVNWDGAGHIVSHTTKTWTLPDSFHDVVVGKESAAVTNGTGNSVDVTLVADTTFDSFSISPSNKWIRLFGNADNDSIVVGHLVQEIATSTPTTDLNSGEGTFATEEYTYDEAGHIRSKAVRTLTLPYSYKTLNVAQSASTSSITTNTGSIIAKNQIDSMTFKAGNKWIELAATTTGGDAITIAHSLQGTAAKYTGTDLDFTEFGGQVVLYGYQTDNAGHVVGYPTYTLTLPKGSYNNSASANLSNVITGMSFDAATGAITTTSENVGTLVLTGYTKLDTTAAAAVQASDTINGAFAALDNRIETEEEARATAITNLDNRIETEEETRANAITNLRMFKTISVDGTQLTADSNADTLSITAGNDGIVLTTTAANDSFTIGHKTGHQVASGFYKLSTDTYGHVSGTTAVTLDDLTGLGAATAENLNTVEGTLNTHINTVEGNLNTHVNTVTGNPHKVTAEEVGLGNVANESKATMFASAALTGNPTAPTQAAGDNSTRIATTAFVDTAIKGQWISNYSSFDALYNAIVEKLVADGYIEEKVEA